MELAQRHTNEKERALEQVYDFEVVQYRSDRHEWWQKCHAYVRNVMEQVQEEFPGFEWSQAKLEEEEDRAYETYEQLSPPPRMPVRPVRFVEAVKFEDDNEDEQGKKQKQLDDGMGVVMSNAIWVVYPHLTATVLSVLALDMVRPSVPVPAKPYMGTGSV